MASLIRVVEIGDTPGILGCPTVNVQVADDDPGAFDFWRSVGYEPDRVLGLGHRLSSPDPLPSDDQ